MESYGLDESINGTNSALPFMVLKYPEGDFGGTRTKCTFNLIPSGEIEMETMILHGGGQFLFEKEHGDESQFAITILCERFYLHNPEEDIILPPDTFSSTYVYDAIECCKKNLALPNLNCYRVTQSKYQFYNPEDILWKRKKWSDLHQLDTSFKMRTTAQLFVKTIKSLWGNLPNHGPHSLQRVGREESTHNLPNLTKKLKAEKDYSLQKSAPKTSVSKIQTVTAKTGQNSDLVLLQDKAKISKNAGSKNCKQAACRRYTQEDGQKMLDLICDKKAFMFTKGNKLFQLLEASQHFPGRSFHSLKAHWKNIVYPKAIKYQTYDISPTDLDLLLKAREDTRWEHHRNICPDLKF